MAGDGKLGVESSISTRTKRADTGLQGYMKTLAGMQQGCSGNGIS